MPEIIKIALTGGPCGGKTTAIKYLKDKLEQNGIKVLVIAEWATKLLESSITPQEIGNYEFHKMIFEKQYDEEQKMYINAKSLCCDKVVIISDRGLLDTGAYVTTEEFNKYAKENNTNADILRNYYDAVFHLVTAADSASEFYNNLSNKCRHEDKKRAIEIDNALLELWTGTNHLRIIDNKTSFDKKLLRLKEEVFAFVGIPKPYEIERKFLIDYPNLSKLSSIRTFRKIPITQAYLTTPKDGNFRVRKRGEGNSVQYIKTVKIKISDVKRIEKENYITKEEYEKYLKSEYVTGVISKDRYCIAYNSTYYELDVYPFWKDKATIEIELIKENQEYELPNFVKLIREVTNEPEYRNYQLAKKFQ